MEDLVIAIAQGDTEAEDRLARIFEPRVRTMALVRTRNPEAARDLTQDTLMAAVEALRKGALREPEKLAAFVLGIARNVINGYFRARDPEPVREPLDSDLIWTGQVMEQDSERRQEVRREIELLDPVDREILMLTLVEGAKPGAIAARLGLSGAIVRQRKLRATRRIAARLSQMVSDPPQNKRRDPHR